MTDEVIKDTTAKMARPKVSSESQKELDNIEQQFKQFNDHVQELTADRMNIAPMGGNETQTKMSTNEMQKAKELYLKPKRTMPCRAKFNERFREDYNFAKEYVNFFAENKEIIGEAIELWTKPFAGVPYEEWVVPVNKPLWGPRYLAEQIKRKYYRRLKMDEGQISSNDGRGTYYGQLTVDTTVQRLDAIPVSQRKSIFMGGSNF